VKGLIGKFVYWW